MNGRASLGQLLLGVVVVLVGVVLLLERAGAVEVDLGDLLSLLWPLAIVLVGVASLAVVPRAWFGPAAITALGAALLLSRFDVVQVSVWDYLWPVAVILVGVGITFGAAARDQETDHVTAFAFWWGTERRTRTRTFRSASLTAIMGGVELDLREAGIEGSARVDVFTFWGGVDIKVPRTWDVRVSGLPVLGGWDDKTQPVPGGPVLEVRVVTVMGGAEVRYGKDRSVPTVEDAPVV